MKTVERPFDILVNGRPEKTLWAVNEEAAIIAAYLNGLETLESDSVKAVKRIHDEE